MSEKKSKKYLQTGNVSIWEHINLLQDRLKTTCDLVLELFSVPKIKAYTFRGTKKSKTKLTVSLKLTMS